MISFVAYDMDGCIVSTGTCHEGTEDFYKPSGGGVITGIQAESESQYVDVTTQKILEKGNRPSIHHEWNGKTKSWQPNVAAAKAAKIQELQRERSHHNFLPITLNGIRLDADATAQKNLSDKLQEVRERLRLGIDMPPDLLVWKDHDNIVHTWDSEQAYHDWLAGFAIALAERGTRLYAAAWAHKAAIAALADVEAVLAYGIHVNWPD